MQRSGGREIRRVARPVLPPTPELDSAGCMDTDQPKAPKPIPDWVLLRPFQYNGRVLATALPGLCLVFSLAGELLLSIIVIGAIILHLIDSGGAKRQSMIAYMCIFIAIQMSIIYSAIPLVWLSVFNLVFLMILNMFVVLTGGWLLLQFESLVPEEPILAELIEISLFSIYPGVSVILMSWIVGTLWSTQYLHYVAILHGFLLLRIFITPNQPSFRKSTHRGSQTGIAYVIGVPEIALMLLCYCIAPPAVFILFNFWNLFNFNVAIELIHVVSTPVFLVSFLELRSWTEHAGIPFKTVTIVRWTSGVVSLIATCAILMQTKSSVLVPWLLPVTALNVILGSLSNRKGYATKALTPLLAIAVGLMYTTAILDAIPWHLDLPSVDLMWLTVILIICAALSLACFMVANTGNTQLLSTLLIANMATVVYIEYTLSHQQLCSAPLLLATTTCAVYLLTRLHNANVIAWHSAWIGTALHSIKILPFLQILDPNSLAPTLLRSAIILFFVLVTTKLVFFEKRTELPDITVYQYVLAICTSVMFFYISVVRRLWLTFIPSPPTVQDATSVFIILCSAICLKLTFNHMNHYQGVRKANILALIAGTMIFILQPTIPKSSLEISDWLIMISLCMILATMSGLTAPSQNSGLAFLQSAMVGFAAGAHTCQYLFPQQQLEFYKTFLYMLSCTLCAFIGFNIWNYNLCKGSKRAIKMANITAQFVVLTVLCVILFVVECSDLTFGKITLDSLALPSTQLHCIIYLIIAVILRVHSAWQLSKDPFNYTAGKMATVTNVSVLLCYALAILNCPIEPWEIWNCMCTAVLLLLQPDPVFMTSFPVAKHSGILATVCMANLFIAAVIYSDLWLAGPGFFCIVELLILACILPFYITLGREFSSDTYFASSETVVFISPLSTILFVVGSSYTSWLLATVGLSAATWFIIQKISSGQPVGRDPVF